MGGLKRRRTKKLAAPKSTLNTFFGHRWARDKELRQVESMTFDQVKDETLSVLYPTQKKIQKKLEIKR